MASSWMRERPSPLPGLTRTPANECRSIFSRNGQASRSLRIEETICVSEDHDKVNIAWLRVKVKKEVRVSLRGQNDTIVCNSGSVDIPLF